MGSNGNCKVCPRNCHWNIHKNLPFIYETIEEQVTKTNEDLLKKYNKAKDDKTSKGEMLESLGQMFGEEVSMLQNIFLCHWCTGHKPVACSIKMFQS